MVNDSRISAGQEFIGRFEKDLKRAEKIYGAVSYTHLTLPTTPYV